MISLPADISKSASWDCALRAPGFFSGPVWPPPLAEAQALVAGRGHGARAVAKYAPRFSVLAASLAATGTESGLLQAYDLFHMIAKHTSDKAKWGPELRTAALQNEAVVLSRLRNRALVRMASDSVAKAVDFLGDLDDAALKSLAADLTATFNGLESPVELEWTDAFTLAPVDATGAARIDSMPPSGVEGRWTGIRKALKGYGLNAPKRPGNSRLCKVTPKNGRLIVK